MEEFNYDKLINNFIFNNYSDYFKTFLDNYDNEYKTKYYDNFTFYIETIDGVNLDSIIVKELISISENNNLIMNILPNNKSIRINFIKNNNISHDDILKQIIKNNISFTNKNNLFNIDIDIILNDYYDFFKKYYNGDFDSNYYFEEFYDELIKIIKNKLSIIDDNLDILVIETIDYKSLTKLMKFSDILDMLNKYNGLISNIDSNNQNEFYLNYGNIEDNKNLNIVSHYENTFMFTNIYFLTKSGVDYYKKHNEIDLNNINNIINPCIVLKIEKN